MTSSATSLKFLAGAITFICYGLHRELREPIGDSLSLSLQQAVQLIKRQLLKFREHVEGVQSVETRCLVKEEHRAYSLPEDLIISIFAYLQVDELLACSLVNVAWQNASESDLLWKNHTMEVIVNQYFTVDRHQQAIYSLLHSFDLLGLLDHSRMSEVRTLSDLLKWPEKKFVAFRADLQSSSIDMNKFDALYALVVSLREQQQNLRAHLEKIICRVFFYASFHAGTIWTFNNSRSFRELKWKRFLAIVNFHARTAGYGNAVIYEESTIGPHHVLRIMNNISIAKQPENVISVMDKFMGFYAIMGPVKWGKVNPRLGYRVGKQNISAGDFKRIVQSTGVTMSALASFWNIKIPSSDGL